MRHRRLSGRRQVHTTPAQRTDTVQHFRRSGVSRATFARRSGLVLSTLNRWLAEATDAPVAPSPVAFSELRLASPAWPAPATAWAVEIVTAQGLTVRCRAPLAAQDLARLLRSLSC